ncbi:PilW family protein [Hydrogenophaga aromaticivorans]
MRTPRHHPSPQARHSAPKRRAQAGVSLIELMVGITVGMLVSVAAVGTLVYNRVSSTMVADTVALQQDAATVMRMIGRQLKQTGAVPVVNDPLAPLKFGYQDTYLGLPQGTPTPAPVSVDGTNVASGDTLRVSYTYNPNQAATVGDCMGESPDPTIPAERDIINTFSRGVDGQFLCQGTNQPNAQPVVNNVEELQFWYAVRDPATNQLRYFEAGGFADWTTVEAVQVCIRLAGTSGNNPTVGVASTGCTGQAVADDGRIRRVFRQVFTLRNLQSQG